MSIQEQEHDSWKILERILLTAKDQPQHYSQFAKIIDKVPHFCAHGYALQALGMSTRNIVHPTLTASDAQSVLGKLGFSKEDRKKRRLCPETNCCYAGRLYDLIAHLNNNHKFKLTVIGRLLPFIRNDTRKAPNLILQIRRYLHNF